MELFPTSQESIQILNDGYSYDKKRSNDSSDLWESSKRRSFETLTADTEATYIQHESLHSNTPDIFSIESMKLCKNEDDAETDSRKPHQLFLDKLKNVPNDVRMAVGKPANIKRHINRIRKRNTIPKPATTEAIVDPSTCLEDPLWLKNPSDIEETICSTYGGLKSPVGLEETISSTYEGHTTSSDTSTMELFQTAQGSLKILNEGYSYTKKKVNRSSIQWECSKKRSSACSGKLTTDIEVTYIKLQSSHSHPSDKCAIEAMKLRRKIYDEAKSNTSKPHKLISDSLKDEPIDVCIAAGNSLSLTRHIRRIKRRNAPPELATMEAEVMMCEQESWGVCWAVVTGASRGLGAEICVAYARLMAPGSCIVGVARSSQGLKTTAQKVKEANPDVQFVPVVLDLGSAGKEDMELALTPTLATLQNTALSKVTMVHNAGSLGDLQYAKNLHDHEHTKKYYEFNISSVITMNAVFMEFVKLLPSSVQCQVINISSLCALVPMKSWGLYCAGKAARDMFFKVLATEEPTLSVLNYSPGPLDGEMQAQVRATSADDEIRTSFTAMKEQGNLLPIPASVDKMLQVIHANKFKSGDHVDYYDEI